MLQSPPKALPSTFPSWLPHLYLPLAIFLSLRLLPLHLVYGSASQTLEQTGHWSWEIPGLNLGSALQCLGKFRPGSEPCGGSSLLGAVQTGGV